MINPHDVVATSVDNGLLGLVRCVATTYEECDLANGPDIGNPERVGVADNSLINLLAFDNTLDLDRELGVISVTRKESISDVDNRCEMVVIKTWVIEVV